NALTLGTLSTGALTAISGGALNLGSGSIGGALVATGAGDITQSGALSVTGTSSLDAGSGAITLTHAGNDFGGAVTATGQGVSLEDIGDLTIASLNSGTNATVSLTAGGALTLPASTIATGTADLTLAANGGSLLVPGALSGANVTLIGRDGISLGNNLSSAGTVTLTSSNGAISQSGGVITAGTLTGSSHGNTTLNQANLVGQLGNFTAANFSLVNAQALAVTGVLSTVGGSGAISLTTTSGALDVQQALSGGAITLDSAGSLALATNITGSTVTLTSDGNISQSGGMIQAGTLTGSAAGSATLSKANKIGTLGNFSATNGVALSNAQALTVSGTVDGGSSTQLTTTAGTLTAGGTIKGDAIALAGQGGLAINGTVNAGAGDIALTSAGGAITEGSAGALIGGGLSGTSAGAMSLGGANQIVTLGNITTGGDFSFRDTRTLTVNSPLAINGGNGNLSLTTTGSTSDLILATDLTGRTVALAAGRDITQAGSAIHAATLTGSAGRDAHFTGANRIGALGDFTASSLEFDNAQALNVTGSVSTGSGALSLATTSGKLTLAGHVSGGATTLDAAGDMALNGALSASSLALQSGGAIAEGSGGVITGNSLTGSATGATVLNGANHVGTLGSFNADGFQFTNAGALAVNGPIDGGSSTRLATTAGDLAVNGRISGTSTELVSAGAITQGSGGKVVAATLTGQSAGATTLTGANSIDTLGSFRAAGLSLSNGKALVVSGPVDGGASAVLTTTAGDLSVEGALSASAVRLVSAGAISESSSGAITAGTLSGQATGATSLGTSSAPVANHIGTLGNFSSPAGFSLTNAQTLTLGAVDGSSFTIDAGHAALYLGVTGGDLLQSGTTPLYDGAGTFFSSGKMGTAKDPIYVIGDSGQVIADVGAPPAYFYALDRQGNILPLTGDLSFNVPTSLFFGKAQNGNGRGDAYIDPSVISANYRSFGIVPSGILLPEDQQQCQPELEDCSSE
ncbi:MAG: beta strand repeat-containing protein, partial [Dyella sp.]|uniref:beta strand repeat-containing protein n=1 Tax=Dyella sp. TaxID=1869338 RepID=UPI003F816B33